MTIVTGLVLQGNFGGIYWKKNCKKIKKNEK